MAERKPLVFLDNNLVGELSGSDTLPATIMPNAGFVLGEVRMFAMNDLPAGWQTCDGSQLAIADYPELYTAIGTTFNLGGEDFAHFRVPNMRYRFPTGVAVAAPPAPNRTLGATGGNMTVTLTEEQMPAHAHALGHDAEAATTIALNNAESFSVALDGAHKTLGYGASTWYGSEGARPLAQDAVSTSLAGSTDAVGEGAPVDITPPFLVLNFAIYIGQSVSVRASRGVA